MMHFPIHRAAVLCASPALQPSTGAHGKQVLRPPDVHVSIGERRSSHQRLAHRVGREERERWPAAHDEHVAILARQVDAIVSSHRRRAEAAALMRETLTVDFSAPVCSS